MADKKRERKERGGGIDVESEKGKKKKNSKLDFRNANSLTRPCLTLVAQWFGRREGKKKQNRFALETLGWGWLFDENVSGRRLPEEDALPDGNQGFSDLRPRLSKISFPTHPRETLISSLVGSLHRVTPDGPYRLDSLYYSIAWKNHLLKRKPEEN